MGKELAQRSLKELRVTKCRELPQAQYQVCGRYPNTLSLGKIFAENPLGKVCHSPQCQAKSYDLHSKVKGPLWKSWKCQGAMISYVLEENNSGCSCVLDAWSFVGLRSSLLVFLPLLLFIQSALMWTVLSLSASKS